jgi:predicted transcriptional regulator with HTH domain
MNFTFIKRNKNEGKTTAVIRDITKELFEGKTVAFVLSKHDYSREKRDLRYKISQEYFNIYKKSLLAPQQQRIKFLKLTPGNIRYSLQGYYKIYFDNIDHILYGLTETEIENFFTGLRYNNYQDYFLTLNKENENKFLTDQIEMLRISKIKDKINTLFPKNYLKKKCIAKYILSNENKNLQIMNE